MFRIACKLVFIFFISLTLSEAAFRLVEKADFLNGATRSWSQITGYSAETKIESSVVLRKENGLLIPNTKIRLQLHHGNEKIFDVIFSSDKFGRRATPTNGEKGKNRHLLLFGCSQTFGRAVSDGETIPSYAASLDPGLDVYNYGVPNGTINNALRVIQTEKIEEQILKKEPGYAVYIYFDYHLQRMAYPRLYGVNGNFVFPIYESVSNKIVYRGYLDETFPNFTSIRKSLLQRSSLIRRISYLACDHIPIKEREVEQAADIMRAAQGAYLSRLKQGRFIVAILSDKHGFKEKLLARGVEVMDLRDIAGRTPTFYPFDGHFLPEANELIARELLKRLPKIAFGRPGIQYSGAQKLRN